MNEYRTITVDMTKINNTTENGTLTIYWYRPFVLANGDTIAARPQGQAFTVTAGAASISLAATDTATAVNGGDIVYLAKYTDADGKVTILGQFEVPTSVSAANLGDLLTAGVTASLPEGEEGFTYVGNLTALAALRNAADGAYVFVQDKGYFYRDEDSTETANGTSVIVSVDGGRWLLDGRGRDFKLVFNAKEYGATGGGSVDDYASLRATFDAAEAAGGEVFIPPGTYLTSAQLEIGASNVTITGVYGVSIIKAKNSANFEHVLYATGRSNLRIANLVVDANQANRAASLTTRANCVLLTGCSDSIVEGVIAKNAIGSTTVPGIGITAGGGGARNRIVNCIIQDCGVAGKAADGVFTSGNQNLIIGCVAKNCLDTGFVVESSNYSGIVGCTALDCGAGAGLTNASANTASCNFINGLTVDGWTASQTGGIQIGNPSASTTGNLINTVVSNVTLRKGTGGMKAIVLRKTGTAKIVGLVLSNAHIADAGEQGILVEGENINITGCNITSTGTPVQVQTGSVNVTVSGCQLYPLGAFGAVASDGCSVVEFRDNLIDGVSGTTAWGVYFFGTTTNAKAVGNTVLDASSGDVGSDAGTTVDRVTVNLTGTQTIAGVKTFSDSVRFSGKVGINNAAPTVEQVKITATAGTPALTFYQSGGGKTGIAWENGNYGFIDYDSVSTSGIRISALVAVILGTNTNAAYGSSTFTESARVTAVGLGAGIDPAGARFHIAAGSTTKAPLKFTAGTNLTTPVAGVMEYQTDGLYFTPTGTSRERLFTGLTNTATLDFPSIAANTAAELTITVTGAAVGDVVLLGPPSGLEAGLVADGRVSATNTVTVRVANVTTGAIDPASATWRATVLR